MNICEFDHNFFVREKSDPHDPKDSDMEKFHDVRYQVPQGGLGPPDVGPNQRETTYECFHKWWVSPTTMGFPTKNDHFGVFWGYPYFWKHPSFVLRKFTRHILY